jgi:ribonuclease PH
MHPNAPRRADGRRADELRPIRLETGYQRYAEGSVLVDWGATRVLCAASVAEEVPPFRAASGGGWVTGEYAMLPRSTNTRKPRRQGGRETEIQRLVGRALRAAVDLDALGPRTITVDCDVLVADGGTRVASITGGFVALALAARALLRDGRVARDPIARAVAAVSVGLLGGVPVLDLFQAEDSRADVDLNLVMTSEGRFVEVQGTAEHEPFRREELDALCDLGWRGIERLFDLQRRALDSSPVALPAAAAEGEGRDGGGAGRA